MRGKVTIMDVAAAAGVSHQTVSRVINNGPNVSVKAREKVEVAVAKLGYSPSLAARRMGGSKSFLLLALNDRDRTIEGWRLREGIDWIDQMLFGGMLTCAEHGYRLIFELVDTHSDQIERELTSALDALRPDGVILTPPHSDNPQILQVLAREQIPAARIGGFAATGGIVIRMDDRAAAIETVEYLAGLGHRRIAFIAGSPEYALSEQRLGGYHDAVARLGLDADPALVQTGDFSPESGEAAARQLLALPHPPTAIIASGDQMALAALSVAQDQGLVVPDDLSLVSFDGTPIVRMSTPPLTSINQPVAELTARAAKVLVDPNGELAQAARRGPIVVPYSLEVRGSTTSPRR